MLESLVKLPIIKMAINSLINKEVIAIITDNEHRVEFRLVKDDNLHIRILVIARSNKFILKTSLYCNDVMLNYKENHVQLIKGDADVSKQLFYIKNFSNFLNSI
jgi:hypothetical protein